MRSLASFSLLALVFLGCGKSSPSADDGVCGSSCGGSPSTGGAGGEAPSGGSSTGGKGTGGEKQTLCETHEDCDDGLECNGFEACDPGHKGADEKGCLPSQQAIQCGAGHVCFEPGECYDEACVDGFDRDKDGHASVGCGGDDCDDDDDEVYPGAEETCDAKDRDCVGGPYNDAVDAHPIHWDPDGDGYASASVMTCDEVTPDEWVESSLGDDCSPYDARANAGFEYNSGGPWYPAFCRMPDDVTPEPGVPSDKYVLENDTCCVEGTENCDASLVSWDFDCNGTVTVVAHPSVCSDKPQDSCAGSTGQASMPTASDCAKATIRYDCAWNASGGFCEISGSPLQSQAPGTWCY